MKIFGSAGLAESTYTDQAQGGIPLAIDSRVMITAPTPGGAGGAGGVGGPHHPASARAFTAAYQRRYGPAEPDSIFGYEAMSLPSRRARIAGAPTAGRRASRRGCAREGSRGGDFATARLRSPHGVPLAGT